MSKPSDKPGAPKPAFTSKAKLLAAPYKHTNGAVVHYHDGAHAFNAQCRYVGAADVALAEAAAKALAPAAPVPASPTSSPTEPEVRQPSSGKGK